MNDSEHIDNPDVILIGSGIMSSTLGAILKCLDPSLKIQLYEATDQLTQESSNGWNNAGTGHAGICELSYTPDLREDGTCDVTKAIEIFQQFEQTPQFWAYAVENGMIDNPHEFINQVPHISFVHGQKQVDFLKARYEGLSQHHFFRDMEFTTDPEVIRSWAPLLIEGREDMPVAATKMEAGADVNFGAASRKFLHWLDKQTDCSTAVSHRVVNLDKENDGWTVHVKDLKQNRQFTNKAKFVFIGAGGGSLLLLQKAGIPEIKGYGGFPVGGQWLVCDNQEVVAKHQAKVYGQAQEEAPTMAVPHLDTRVLDGKKWLLFGPFAAWTTKFLDRSGHWSDLPGSIKPANLTTLINVGVKNVSLVKYLMKEGTQSMASRIKLLKSFYPEAQESDWKLMKAGIRVQAIKKEDGQAGIVHYGTEVLSSEDRSICALLGASPGASVCVSIMMEVIEKCMPEIITVGPGAETIQKLIPTYGKDFIKPDSGDQFIELNLLARQRLMLTD